LSEDSGGAKVRFSQTADQPLKEILQGIAGGQVQDHPPHRPRQAGPDLQQSQANGADLRLRQFGLLESQSTQRFQQHIGR